MSTQTPNWGKKCTPKPSQIPPQFSEPLQFTPTDFVPYAIHPDFTSGRKPSLAAFMAPSANATAAAAAPAHTTNPTRLLLAAGNHTAADAAAVTTPAVKYGWVRVGNTDAPLVLQRQFHLQDVLWGLDDRETATDMLSRHAVLATNDWTAGGLVKPQHGDQAYPKDSFRTIVCNLVNVMFIIFITVKISFFAGV